MSELAFVMSTTALALYCLSYFFNSKRNYLILQLAGNVFLSFSYLLIGSYFTMIAVIIGIARGMICYIYEKKDKKVPIFCIIGLCFVTILSYIIVNCVVLQSQASIWDFLYLFASCMYAVTFAIRNLKVMRYMVLIPHASAVAYNLLIQAPISSAISYGIELVVTVVAIIKYEVTKGKNKNKYNENTTL
ncbi:MAG: YgjV family protein [Clostridia bacterium]|nr:YgjV family protein [Clostridia bacterium]